MSKLGYARVSTEEQSLDLQLIALRKAGCSRIFTDHGVSGMHHERPGLHELISAAKSGDTIVVWRLDRLGRSLKHLIQILSDLRERGIHFASLNEAIDTGTPTGTFIFHMLAALAEFERSLISERTKAGMAVARTHGSHLGRPRILNAQQIKIARELEKTFTAKETARLLSVDKRTLERALQRDSNDTHADTK
ncbi:recombinase family protein [Burkholderia sp. AU33545]|uniref:recombinase family protein n=1 Tax=unclassified Burkholderia TaxID=2613784 RepID=UPI000F5FB101|nr:MULTISPECIES: recombinase family protein [unclassified Burkholderia]MCA8204717.1 recombinase family protein [Burkholderia sp. AU33545]RQZ69190.1 recombinase family protein [Burkholderia sp. Bp9004]